MTQDTHSSYFRHLTYGRCRYEGAVWAEEELAEVVSIIAPPLCMSDDVSEE